MSEPIDARALRRMVRETASETHAEIDWDAAEERLLARLDAPPSELAKSLLESSGREEAGDDESDAGPAVLEMGDSGSFQAPAPLFAGSPDGLPDAVVHVPGLSKLAIVDDAATSGSEELPEGSSATDSDHSPSLIHEPPKRRTTAARPEKQRARWGAIAGALALAACAAVFFGGGTHLFGRTNGSSPTDSTISAERWVDPADVAMAPGLDNVRDLGALRAGDVVEATQGAVSFGAKDRLTWTLSPGSRVLVRSGLDDGASMRHVLVLENGSIRADVRKPSGASGEPFIVEAGDTDVDTDAWDPDTGRAVFSVTRSSIGIVVDVEVGAATVGSRIDGSKKRMSAPARAAVSLDGAHDFKLLDPIKTAMREAPRPDPIAPLPTPDGLPERIRPQPPSVPEPARPAPQAPDAQTAAPAEPPAAPRPADAALTESAISSMLNSCFADVQAKRKANDQDPNVAVSMHSTLSLVVDSESSIHAAGFNPPLRPDLQSCAVGLLHKKVTGGARTISLPIDISR